jgi:pimeloyl-ACP methyl ester carboxylesterase
MQGWETHLRTGSLKEVNGLETFYVSMGSGPAVLLIHGWAASSFTWRKVYGPLSARFHVVAVDLPGFGNSQPLPGGLSLDGVGTHITALMDALAVERFAVVGHSMGGVVASYLAAAYPERVWATVLAAPGFMTFSRGRRPFYVELARRRAVGRLLAGFLVNRRFVGRALRNACQRKEVVDDEMVEGYLLSIKKNPATLLEAFNITEGFSLEMLERVKSPVLMVWGSDDRWVPISVGYEVSEKRGWSVVVVDGTGHLPHEEKPEEFESIVRGFLTQTSPSSSV